MPSQMQIATPKQLSSKGGEADMLCGLIRYNWPARHQSTYQRRWLRAMLRKLRTIRP